MLNEFILGSALGISLAINLILFFVVREWIKAADEFGWFNHQILARQQMETHDGEEAIVDVTHETSVEECLEGMMAANRQEAVTMWSLNMVKYTYLAMDAAADDRTSEAAWYTLVASECAAMAEDPSRPIGKVLEQEKTRILSA